MSVLNFNTNRWCNASILIENRLKPRRQAGNHAKLFTRQPEYLNYRNASAAVSSDLLQSDIG